ncbi:RNA polymerase sigma factor [Aquirufa rosea]|uniref:RNA polymerase sigma factor n=1 Tax=Aquirufa rosea TaxID=2509241 RepID=A0A4Q1C1V4_9BACT|nr:RNA polymerase sigma factor [Aquirufa rosea]RXK51030.1 RNA polymerase sigma factor [Aquirufa rosea]
MNKNLLPFHNEEELIEACQKQDRRAQHIVYQINAGKMMAVCKRYLGVGPDAEDALMEGFMKVFGKIDNFQGQGSFEGWIRKIMVNESLMKLRKSANRFDQDIDETYDLGHPEDAFMHLGVEDIQNLILELPPGYRTIFNLYAIEGYSHVEIADMLQISEGTSKSQLSRARQILQNKLKELQA